MLKQMITPQTYSFLPSLSPARAAWETLSTALQELFLRRYSIRWRHVYHGSQADFITGLPGYPLNLSRYIVPYKPLSGQNSKGSGGSDQQDKQLLRYAFLTTVSTTAEEGDPSIRRASTAMGPIREFIEAHRVGEVPLCPASVFLEVAAQALAHHAALDMAAANTMFMLENVRFDHPLIGGAGDHGRQQHNSAAPAIQTTLMMHPVDGQHSYTCTSASSGETLCAGGIRSLQTASRAAADILARRQGRVARLKRSLDDAPGSRTESFSAKTIYHLIFPRVVQYGKRLMTLHQLTTSTSDPEGYGVFELPPAVSSSGEDGGRFVTSPAFADTLLHAPGFMANTLVGPDTACICVAVEQALLPSDGPSLHRQRLRVYCSLVDIGHSFIADAYALDDQDRVVGYLEGICFKKLKLEAFKAHLLRRQLAAVHGPDAAARGRGITAAAAAAGRSKTAAISVSTMTRNNAIPAAAAAASSPGRSRGHGARSTTTGARRPPESVANSSPDISMAVCSAIRDLCGMDSQPTGTTTLAELGLDSLLCVELSHALTEMVGCEISHDQLQTCANVAAVLDLVINKSQSMISFSYSSTSPGQSTSHSSSAETSSQGPDTGAAAAPMDDDDDDDERMIMAASAALQSELASLTLSVCGVLPEDPDTPLSAFGVDSLLSIELCQALRAKLGITLDDHAEVGDLTYRQLEDMCAARRAAATGATKKAEVVVVLTPPSTSAGLAS
jgi:acyl carrier protein